MADREIISLGQIQAIFCEWQDIPSLCLVPQGMEGQVEPEKLKIMTGMAQLHVRGAGHRANYARGTTMLASNTAYSMRLAGRVRAGAGVITKLKNDQGLVFEQELTPQGRALRCRAHVRNEGGAPITLDHAATFCISGMTPFEAGGAPDCLRLHRFTSFWSGEGRHECQTLEELGLESGWTPGLTRCLRIGQTGTLPVRGYFPTMALEDTRRQVTWAVNLGWAGSWSMELYRRGDRVNLCGGLAGFDEGHFRKTLQPGEELTLPEACLTVVRGGIDEACEALLDGQKAGLEIRGEAEETLNPMYNEYLETWGKPTEKSVRAGIRAVKELGLSYFVIDAGWFGTDKSWSVSTGDWQVRKSAFPEGMRKIADEIRAAGMIPGIWFEAEVASDESQVVKEHPEMFLQDDGKTIVETNRAFLNLTREDAQAYLQKKVIDFLKENHFGYIKVDYNNTYGVGFDGFESLGEAQRQNVLGTYRFFDSMRRQLPDLIVENCASGGHRLEMSMMSRCSMASFSDAHECPEIPLIAADLHRLILPRQSQIWAAVKPGDSLRRLIWSVAAGTLGRLCLSGPIAQLNEEQMAAVHRGVEFYRLAAPAIAEGSTRVYRRDITGYQHAHGWQAAVRTGTDRILITAHAFEKNGGGYELPVLLPGWRLAAQYADDHCGARIDADGRVTLHVDGEYCAVCALLEKI